MEERTEAPKKKNFGVEELGVHPGGASEVKQRPAEALLYCLMMTALLAPSYSSHLFALQPPPPRPRHAPLRLQEPPFPLPYEVPEQEKPFADYVWDSDRLQ